MNAKLNSMLTIVIKTFERPCCINRIIDSIFHYYPKMMIIVADDSRNPGEIDSVDYHKLPFNSGISYGRNFLIDKVKTKYFLLLDDDFIFTEKTDLNTLLNILEHNDIDLLAGNIMENLKLRGLSGIGVMRQEGGTLYITRKEYIDKLPNYYTCDFVPNFFMADTERIKQAGAWDNELKVQEHWAFFYKLRGKVKTAFCPEVEIEHKRETNERYESLNGNIVDLTDQQALGKQLYKLDKVIFLQDGKMGQNF
jgi:glycosyltransferase involved in cell wall biosynthesis